MHGMVLDLPEFDDLTLEGRPGGKPLVVEGVRELTGADLALLGGHTPRQPTLKQVRSRHHALAKAIASGLTVTEAAMVAGYTVAHANTLNTDPTFTELVAFYRKHVLDEYTDMHARLAGLGDDMIAELRQRLEEAPEEISFSQLLKGIEVLADRTGHGPQTSQLNVNVNVASRLELARKRAETVRRERVLELTAEEVKSGNTQTD